MINKQSQIIKWLKFVPAGTLFTKSPHNIGLFLKTQMTTFFFNFFSWNKLWFFLKYSLITFKNMILSKFSFLIVSDYQKASQTLKTIGKTMDLFYSTGPWEGGRLSKTRWYKYTPSFVIIFGMHYPQRLYNELQILGIPNFNFSSHFLLKQNTANNYLIPFLHNTASVFKNFVFFFSYCLFNLMYNTVHSVFTSTQTFNPFFYQTLRAIFFKTKNFKKLHQNFYKVSAMKKVNSTGILFFKINTVLTEQTKVQTWKIVYSKNWFFLASKKYKMQIVIRKSHMNKILIQNELFFNQLEKKIETRANFWVTQTAQIG